MQVPARFRRWIQLFAALAGLILAAGVWGHYVFFGQNFHPVISAVCYRSAQLAPAELTRIISRHGIHTVVNLRGANTRQPWYARERQCTQRLGVKQVDVLLGSSYAPSEVAIRRLVGVIDTAEPPLLIHCRSGADRTGLVAACYKLLKTDADVATAAAELSLSFGHNPVGSARCMDCLLDDYSNWLRKQELPHTPQRFRDWTAKVYSRPRLVEIYHLPKEEKEDED